MNILSKLDKVSSINLSILDKLIQKNDRKGYFLKDRLKKIRTTLGYNQQDFASMLDIEVNTYRGYEYKTKNFPNSFLLRLMEVFNVSLDYLFSGQGSMFVENNKNSLSLNCMEVSTKDFGKRYTKILAENNITDVEFSKITGISCGRLMKLGIGKLEPTIDDLNKIKSNIDVDIDWLLYGDTSTKSNAKSTQINDLSASELRVLKDIVKRNKELFE